MTQPERQLHELVAWLHCVREEERTRVARELHDGPVQTLTALTMNLAWTASHLAPDSPNVVESLQASIQLIADTIQTLREMAIELRPGILDLGLQAAMEWQAEEFQLRSGITCKAEVLVEDSAWSPHVATQIFRIFQETLIWMGRDSQAERVSVTLKPEQDGFLLEIRQSGPGHMNDAVHQQSALELMATGERASMIGAELSTAVDPENGSSAFLRIPIQRAAARLGASL